MAKKREMVREASQSWEGVYVSNGEDKDCCKHSDGRPKECKMNVDEGDTKILLQRRGQEGRIP